MPALDLMRHSRCLLAMSSICLAASALVVDLPGVDVINSSYNAVTWNQKVNNSNEEESCYDTFTGAMPNYKQCDPRWKCFPYAGQANLSTCNTTACHDGGSAVQTHNICGSGCGITSSAMVLSYHSRRVTPPDVAKYLLARGFRNDLQNITGATCNGVSHIAICSVAGHWGLGCNTSGSFADLDQWLRLGPVITNVRHRRGTQTMSCKFTKSGHYIVVTGGPDTLGRYQISDPNSCDESNTHGTEQELSIHCDMAGFVGMFNVTPSQILLV